MQTTTNLKLSVPELADTIQSDVLAMGQNFIDIDTAITLNRDQIPQATATGTTFNVQDSSNLPIKSFELGGNTTQDGTPTPDSPVPIQVVTGDNVLNLYGNNILNPNNFNVSTYVATIDKINSVISVTENSSAGTTKIFDNLNLPSGTYTIWCEVIEGTYTGGTLMFYNLSNEKYSGEFNFKSSSSHKYSTNFINGIGRISIYQPRGSTGVKIKIWIVQGDYSSIDMPTYDSYQSLVIQLGSIELAKIGTYQDRIYKSGGKWYLEKNINKGTFDGTENWYYNSDTSVFYSTKYFDYVLADNVPLANLCLGVRNKGSSSGLDTYDYIVAFGTNTTQARFFFRNKDYTDTDNLKTFLSSNNLIIYYWAKTPTTTEITDTTLIQQLENVLKMHTNKNTTNGFFIVASGNVEGELKVEYYQDIQTLINNLNNAILSLGNNV